MSIESPVGTLDIKNATLRVGKLEVSNIQGIDTALNVTRANSVLIYDDQASTTTFNGTTSSAGVRDTVNGYLDVSTGYVYWGQKLPNSWVMDFEMDIRSGTNAGSLYANVFSTTNTGGDGYSFTFNDSNDKITLKYDGTTLTESTVSGLFTASESWQKVVINYERGLIAISVGGSRKFYYKDIERETPYTTGEYISFSSASTDGRKIRDLRIVNGEKWVYAGESNVVYTQGSVGVGVTDPQYTLDVGGDINFTGTFYQGGSPFVSSLWTSGNDSLYYTASNVGIGTDTAEYTLDVHGNANVGALTTTSVSGDGSALYGIQSSNVSDFASNVTRIGTLETDLSSNATRVSTLETDLGSNVTRIGTLETDLSSNATRVSTLETDLGSNVTRIGTLETGNMTISGQKTFSGDVIFESNVHMQGDVFVANTVNMTVSDPIIELGSNNLNTGDLGIIMTRHGATNSNIAIVFDESADVLRMGYTLGGASDADITLDSNALAVSVQGALTAASVSGDGSGLSSIQSSNVSDFASNVGRIGTLETDLTSNVTRIATLETDLTSNVTRITNLESSDMTIGGEKTFSSNLQVGTADLFVNTNTSNVGIGTTNPQYKLDVDGGTTEGDGDIMLRMFGAVNKVGKLIFGRTGTTDIRSHAIESITNAGGANNYMKFMVHDGGNSPPYETRTEVMTLLGDGNVGIGTNSPVDLFHVANGTIRCSDAGNTINIPGLKVRRRAAAVGQTGSNYIECGQFNDVGNDGSGTDGNKFIVTNTGNVGIGTTSPIAALDINGGAENNTTPALSIRGGSYDPSDLYVLNTYNTNTGVGYAAKVIGVNIKNKVETDNTVQIRNNVGGVTSAGAIYLGADDVNQGIFGVLGGTGVAGSTLGEYLTVKANGNVGIGTNSPSHKLNVRATSGDAEVHIQAQGNDGGDAILYFNGANADQRKCAIISSNVAPNSWCKQDLYFCHNTDSNSDDVTIADSKMVITNNGNVGIGTNDPTAHLHVSSGTSGDCVLKLEADTDNNNETDNARIEFISDGGLNTALVGAGQLPFSSENLNALVLAAYQTIFYTGVQNFTDSTNMLERMRITHTGNVGIGTVSPQEKLHVYTDSAGSGSQLFIRNANASNRTGLSLINSDNEYFNIQHASGSSNIAIIENFSQTNGGVNFYTKGDGRYEFRTTNSNSLRMIIDNNGNVGIGIESPVYTLDVNGVSRSRGVCVNSGFSNNTARPALSTGSTHPSYEIRSIGGNGNVGSAGGDDGFLRLRAGGGTGTNSASYIDLSGYSVYSGNDMKRNIVFGTFGTERMRILENGNVGIGTTSPDAKLYVVTSSSTPALYLRNSTNAAGCKLVMTDQGSALQRCTLTYFHGDGSSLGAENRLHFSTTEALSVFSTEGTLMIGVDGKDNGAMGSGNTVGRKNLFIQSTYNGNTSQNYGWWIGAQNQAPSASDNDLYFGVVRNGTLTVPALIQDNQSQATMNFTGQHRTFVKGVPIQQLEDKEGLIVSADQNDFIRMSGGVARGNEAITTNESLPIVSFSTKSNDKKCFGVISTTEDPENRVEVYGNFASNMHKELGDTRVYINSVGEGAIWVTDINGPLESGDYITTSNVAGYGMRQEDDILHNYTVAKITMDCDFNPRTQPKKIIKKELANVDYWIDYATSEIKQEEYETLPENEREIREDKYYKIYKREIQKTNPENDKFVHEVHEELVNVLDAHGQLQWEDDPSGATEKAYKIRYLDTSGQITDEANAVHIAAFVGCTYHCG